MKDEQSAKSRSRIIGSAGEQASTVRGSGGFIVAIDGPDGVGKTTQVDLLKDYFLSQKEKVHVARQSGGTPIGEELRKVSLSSHPRSAVTDLFISLAMGSALSEDLTTRKNKGEIVIIDRSPLAIIAYNGYGSQLQEMKLAFDACEALFKREQIDLLIFLDAPTEVTYKRRKARNAKDYFENQNDAFHDRVREGYKAGLELIQNKNSGIKTRIAVVDASTDVDSVQKLIIGAINSNK